jgi:hypothetical protein
MEIGIGLWALFAFVVGLVASREFGRSAPLWFALSLIFSPAVGALLFLLPPQRMPCPFCAELIKPTAQVCRFCNRPVTLQAEGPVFSGRARIGVLLVVLAGLFIALSRCDSERGWWEKDKPVQVVVRSAC